MRNQYGEVIVAKLEQGEQILYVPTHMEYNSIKGAILGPMGIQPGFVTSGPNKDGAYFCRYWLWDYAEKQFVPELRTKANSELTDHLNIVLYPYFNQSVIVNALTKINEGFV